MAASKSWSHVALSKARCLAVARPKLSGCRSSSTVLNQVCLLGLSVLRRQSLGRPRMCCTYRILLAFWRFFSRFWLSVQHAVGLWPAVGMISVVCPSVSPCRLYCVALGRCRGVESCTVVFLAGYFLFTSSVTSFMMRKCFLFYVSKSLNAPKVPNAFDGRAASGPASEAES